MENPRSSEKNSQIWKAAAAVTFLVFATGCHCKSIYNVGVGDDIVWDFPPHPRFYQDWADGVELSVNDILCFTYDSTMHRVVQVQTQGELDECRVIYPLLDYSDSGALEVRIEPRVLSKTYYFMSLFGNGLDCDSGMKFNLSVYHSSSTKRGVKLGLSEALASDAVSPSTSPSPPAPPPPVTSTSPSPPVTSPSPPAPPPPVTSPSPPVTSPSPPPPSPPVTSPSPPPPSPPVTSPSPSAPAPSPLSSPPVTSPAPSPLSSPPVTSPSPSPSPPAPSPALPPPVTSPSPSPSPPAPSPVLPPPVTSPSPSPSAPAPSPASPPPVTSPSPSPSAPAPSPLFTPPVTSPAPLPPAPSPLLAPPVTSPSPSPSPLPPAPSPLSTPPVTSPAPLPPAPSPLSQPPVTSPSPSPPAPLPPVPSPSTLNLPPHPVASPSPPPPVSSPSPSISTSTSPPPPVTSPSPLPSVPVLSPSGSKGSSLTGSTGKKGSSLTVIIVGVAVGLSLVVVSAIVGFIIYRRYRKQTSFRHYTEQNREGGETEGKIEFQTFSGEDKMAWTASVLPFREASIRGEQKIVQCKLFTLEELKIATSNFSEEEKLGEGGFGTVYKGILRDGKEVAVKRAIAERDTDVDSFLNEVSILSQLNHCNLVKLLGCCMEHKVPILVFEFISNGTLYDHLRNSRQGYSTELDWNRRFNIALQTAEGLKYLHSQAQPPIIHRDVKAANILLDDDFGAKVADFGISKLVDAGSTHVSTGIRGTPGYLDPEYFSNGQLTDKSDVYSYGIVLLELITSQKPIDDQSVNVTIRMVSLIKKKRTREIIDTRLVEELSENDFRTVEDVAEVAVACLERKRVSRPTMSEVVEMLQRIKGSKLKADAFFTRNDITNSERWEPNFSSILRPFDSIEQPPSLLERSNPPSGSQATTPGSSAVEERLFRSEGDPKFIPWVNPFVNSKTT